MQLFTAANLEVAPGSKFCYTVFTVHLLEYTPGSCPRKVVVARLVGAAAAAAAPQAAAAILPDAIVAVLSW